MRSRLAVVVVAGGSLVLSAGPAGAATKNVQAAGNPFTDSGNLAFKPKDVTVKVGDFVRWTNTDSTVPHTATEVHQLWDLTGTYGLPGNYGFGPGESRQRKFEAGTQHYYCKVHPKQMRGVVRVPVRTSVKKLAYGTRQLRIRWAGKAPQTGQVYDVQIRPATSGPWYKFRTGTRETNGTRNNSGAKVTYTIRARLRKAKDKSQATGWSPVVTVKV